MKNSIDYVLQLCRGSSGKLSKPFIRGDFVYSTNSFLMVRTPRAFISTEYSAQPDINPEPMYERGTISPIIFEIPTKDALGILAGYSGFVERRGMCKACHGTGNGECPHCGHDSDCEDCAGSGKSSTGNPLSIKFSDESVNISGVSLSPELFNVIVLIHVIAGADMMRLEIEGAKVFANCGPYQTILMTRSH